jgi:hypothetical protein
LSGLLRLALPCCHPQRDRCRQHDVLYAHPNLHLQRVTDSNSSEPQNMVWDS